MQRKKLLSLFRHNQKLKKYFDKVYKIQNGNIYEENKIKRPLIIIPARLGSKRLKNKNILPVKGLPMFVYVAKKVQKSIFSPYIFVSSISKNRKICKYK